MAKCLFRYFIIVFLLIATLPSFSQNPAAEWRMDECQWTGTAGEVVDTQGNGYDGTAVNGASTAAGKLCNGGVFDGNSSYVNVPNSNFNFGNRMSVAAWVKWDIDPASGQNYANIISINSTSQTDTGQFWLQHDNNNQHFQFAVTTTNARYFVNSTTSPIQGVWYHVVGVYDRNRIRIYVNGSKEAEKNTQGNVTAYNSAYALNIGRWAYTGFPRAFSGLLDEVKVYTRRLRDSDVSRLYDRENSGKNYDNSTRNCPACQALAEWRMDECFWSGTSGEVLDSTGNGYDGTAAGTATPLSTTPFLCQYGDLTGTGYVTLPNHPSIGSAWTYAMWVLFPLSSASHNPISYYGNFFCLGSVNGTGDLGYISDHNGSNLRWGVYDNSGNFRENGFPDDLSGWHHLTLVADGNGHTRMYIDGSYHNRVSAITTGDVEYIGTSSDDTSGETIGAGVDEVILFDSAFSDSQVQDLYNNEAAGNNWDGSPRTCPYCGPTANYRMDECRWTGTAGEVLDSSPNGYNGTPYNAATTTNGGILCHAATFNRNGTSDYAVLDNRAIDGAQDFTFMGWFRSPKAGNQVLISGAASSNANEWLLWHNGSSTIQTFLFGSAVSYTLPYAINDDQWHHIVWERSGTTESLYLDGSLVSSNTRSANPIAVDTGGLMIGQEQDCVGGCFQSGQVFVGEIDELLFYGYALPGSSIQSIYNNQQTGFNRDGSARTCPLCDADLELRMDECIWNGTTGEAVDSSNHGHDGTAEGGAITDDADAKLCRDGELIGSRYLSLSNGITLGNSWTAAMWVRFPLDSSGHNTVGSYGNSYIIGSVNGTGDMALIYDSGGTDLRWGVYDNSGHLSGTDFPDNLSGWHHLTFVGRSGGSTDLFIDGTYDSNVPMRTTGDVTYICTSSDDPAGQTIGAAVDEYKIFNSELTNAQITQIYNNESTGINWDGSARICPSCSPVANYHLDECYWDGTSGQVADASGNGNDGTAHGNANTGPGGIVCRCANFNSGGATGQYVTFPASVVDGLRDFSFNTWVKPEDTATHTLLSGAGSSSDNDILLYASNTTTLETYIAGASQNSYSLSDLGDGNWHMITWTRKNGTESIYEDGALVASNSVSTATLSVQSLIIGQEQDSVGGGFNDNQAFRGLQDEVTFWNRALVSSEVSAIYNNENGGLNLDGSARTCPTCVLITYYEIQHDGSAIVCYPERIHIVARDSSGGVVTGFTGTIALSTSSGNGTWYTSYSGLTNDDPPQGTFSDATADDGQATYTFVAGDQGEITLFLRDTHAETLQITASDGTYTSAGHNSGDLVFRPSGFAIKDTGGSDIPNQISGHDFTVTITAIGEDPQSGQCTALDYSGTKTIDATLFYNDPSSGSTPFILDGNNVTSSGTSIQLNFTNSTATVSATYNDAGKIWFRLTDSAENITGDSAVFVVKPWAYSVTADGNPGAADASGNVFCAAGDTFTLQIKAVCWNSADDTDNDLVPDSGADLSDNTVTANYSASVTVSHSLTAPSGGAAGNLTGIPGTISDGELTAANTVYDEVGIITITVDTADYLGAGDVSGTSGDIGRFTPKYIDIPTFVQNPACTAGAHPFTYAEEPFSIDTTLTAKATGGTVTTNYTGDFAKLASGDLALAVQSGSGSLSVGTISFTFNNGTALFTIPGNRYGWGSAHDPETVTLNISGSDSDSVSVSTDTSGTAAVSSGVSYRYGRLQVLDSFSPSTRDLTLTIAAQYYSAGDYVANTDDSCTTYTDSNITLQNWQGNLTAGDTGISAFTTVTDGNGSVTLSAPGLSHEGMVDIILNAPAWFTFDAGTATFGIYRGDDRFISWQEIQK